MRNSVLFATMLLFSSMAFAQSASEEMDLIQEVFGKEKKALVSEFVQLESPQNEAFWSLYDEYETKRKELGKKRVDLLGKYASSYPDLDDATTSDIIDEMMKLQSANDKLIASYTKKIKKKVGVTEAAEFYQIEGYVLSKIRSSILENIPVFGNY